MDMEISLNHFDMEEYDSKLLEDCMLQLFRSLSLQLNISWELFTEKLSSDIKNINDFLFHLYYKKKSGQSTQNDIKKFILIFKKTRFDEFINIYVFNKLSIDECANFDLKIYRKLLSMYLFTSEENVSLCLGEYIKFFGLFKNDENKNKRLNDSLKLLDERNYTYEVDEDSLKVIKDVFVKFDENYYYDKFTEKYYVLKNGLSVPPGLDGIIYEKYPVKKLNSFLNKLSKYNKENYLKLINEYYDTIDMSVYRAKKSLTLEDLRKLSAILIHRDKEIVSFNSFHLIDLIARINTDYNSGASDLFIKNYEHIARSKVSDNIIYSIFRNFNDIKKKNPDINLDFYKYLSTVKDIKFDCSHEYEKFAFDIKNAGVIDNENYKLYEDLYKKARERTVSEIIYIPETEFEFEENMYSIELLKLDDPFLVYMGENNYFKNCQTVYSNGKECLNHLCTSNSSRAFVVRLINPDGSKNLLASSWVWQNENVFCFDNIELHPHIARNQKVKEHIIMIYQMWSQIIMNISNLSLAKYTNNLLDIFINNMKNGEVNVNDFKKAKSLYEKQKISSVVVGSNQDFIDSYFDEELKVNEIRPKNYYGWTDTKKVYLIAGTGDIKDFSDDYQMVAIHEDKDIYIKVNEKK